jgi:hypothetical protein
MDIRAIINPTVQDREALEEFADALVDRAPEVERDVARLKKTPGDREITADFSAPSTTSREMLHFANSILARQ